MRQAVRMSEPRPGLPGEIPVDPVDADDYRDPDEPRRGRRDVDPAPLAWLLSVQLKTVESDPPGSTRVLVGSMRVLAEGSDADIHLARLLGACEYAARKTGGTLARVVHPAGDGSVLWDAVQALVSGGLGAAAKVFREMPPGDRYCALDAILDYWARPATALRVADELEVLIQVAGERNG
jgi:hypothetical protein